MPCLMSCQYWYKTEEDISIGTDIILFLFKEDNKKINAHPKLKGNRTYFLETLIPIIDRSKSLQLHL